MYIARLITKKWRKIVTELGVELQIFKEKWKLLLAGLIFQYIHGLAAHGVHYLHRPGPVLQDLGFIILPELGKERFYISETLFSVIFFSFILWTFHPFIYKRKRFYTVLLWRRVLTFLVASQFLRIITFYSTQLPGPSYHCHEGSEIATLPPPDNMLEVLLINFPRGVVYGYVKTLAWLMAITQSLLIIASHKHYSVDVVVAWYTVNLVVFFIDKKLPEMPDRTGNTGPLLPLNSKEKDTKEESRMLLTVNSADNADRRQRMQINGKRQENGNHSEANSSSP